MADETYETAEESGENWQLWLGDSCERMAELETDSVALSVSSPPFVSLYTFSDSLRDLSNNHDTNVFHEQYGFIIRELLRITMPGRVAAVHCTQLTRTKATHGYRGVHDFRGDLIRDYEQAGWIYNGEVCIWKNPQALKDGTPVLTPRGWRPIESVAVGDEVIGSSGRGTRVIDVPFKGDQPIYRVTFSDGGSVECGPEHLWSVRTSPKNPWTVKRTDELIEAGRRASGAYKYEIPVVAPVEFDTADAPVIDPLTFGALLADGSWSHQRGVSLTKDAEYVESLPLPEGHQWVRRPGTDRAGGRTATFGITSNEWHNNEVLSALRTMGLEDCRAWEKHIPPEYLLGTVESRKRLLSGLLNGDGHVSLGGGIDYRTTSAQLAHDVQSLVRSLGGCAAITSRPGGIYDGKQGRELFSVQIRIDWNPFTLARKASRVREGRRVAHRYIASVVATGDTAPVTCISVAAPDGLFVTEHFAVTHNSQAIRTKSQDLMFVSLRKDAALVRPAIADYVLLFKKPGDNQVPIDTDVSEEEWIQYASPIWLDNSVGLTPDGHFTPIWLDIRQTNTLNERLAKDDSDERHISPLQLDLIERCVRLWSNPGELVFDPFGGIGSTPYVAVKNGRRGLGIELKRIYWEESVRALRTLDQEMATPNLFDELDAS